MAHPGFFGSDGRIVIGEFSQTFKIPHLRNAYTKIGTFGFAEDPVFNAPGLPFYDVAHKGDQIRGFGYTHDGSKDSRRARASASASIVTATVTATATSASPTAIPPTRTTRREFAPAHAGKIDPAPIPLYRRVSSLYAVTVSDPGVDIASLQAALAAAEQALARATQRAEVLTRRLDGFVANIPGILWESYSQQSPQLNIVDYVSDRIEALSGYTAAEWKRPNFWLELIHPDDRDEATGASQRVFRDGHGMVSYRWIARDGRVLWVTSRMTLITDDAGAPIGLRGVTMDVTDVKLAEAQRVELAMRDEMMRAQEETLLSLSTPLIPIDDDLVAMPLIGALDLRRLERVQQALLDGITATRAKLVILDLTGVAELDEQTAEALVRTARAVALLGAEAILTGIRPDVASTLVHFGTDLRTITTRSTLKSGIAYALAKRRR